tara:strand:+ start:1200 stop:1475 length:276 start_codon:yes stop_codon:yes gene_type:complete
MIKIIQLTTGEMIIAEINRDSEIKNPLFIHQQAVEGQGPKVNLFPYNILGQGKMELNPDNIVWTVDPEQQLLNQYQEAFSSIITPPGPKLV